MGRTERLRAVIRAGWPLIVLVTAVLIFFHKMAFSNLILARGDTFLYFYPYWQAAADALRAGDVPLWNPALFMGAPFLANSQAGFFYPPNWPVWAWLRTPYAASAAIIAHLLVAGAGTYFAARRWLLLGWSGALLAALAFALGGYLTAQVEHINQVQGLAWLPWLLWAAGAAGSGRQGWLRTVGFTALFFALQVLAGHTQTAFITAVALATWISAVAIGEHLQSPGGTAVRAWLARLSAAAAGGGLALLIAAVQLWPTFELAGLSSRQGGLAVNEVLSFSLPPLHLTRALLLGYGQSLFSEYVAFLPLSFLALAFVGGWKWRCKPAALAALVLAIAGLFLALGAFNPLYWLLARLPGFDLFRAPARWLALYALGVSLLVGYGWQIVSGRLRQVDGLASLRRPLTAFALVLVLLMGWGWLGGTLTGLLPTGAEAPYEAPSALTAAGWLLELLLLALAVLLVARARSLRQAQAGLAALVLAGLGLLFLASRALPYNNLTTPEAYFDLRPSPTRLLVSVGRPPERFLSLSDTFFDPGDQAEIDSIYADQLLPPARYDYTVAIKQKEIIAPNLPLVYGLAAVDGFDGGILPLRAYSQLLGALLPEEVQTTDGRLREHLDQVPDARWLDLFNARFLITDKVGDEWRDGVFYDRQHPVELPAGATVEAGFVPPFEATELRLLADGAPAEILITAARGPALSLTPEPLEDGSYRVEFSRPLTATAITVASCVATDPCRLHALTLVDSRDGTFQTLVPGAYRMIHSGDVKIYENLDVLPRAFLVDGWTWAVDGPAAVATLSDPDFELRDTAVLSVPANAMEARPAARAASGVAPGTATFVDYQAQEILLRTEGEREAMLILTDAAYPGWSATVDGRESPIYLADGLFRAVHLPAGSHEVAFRFAPQSYAYGRWLSLLGLLFVAVIFLVSWRRHRQKVS